MGNLKAVTGCVVLFEINQMRHWECWMNEYTYMLAYYSGRSKQIKEVDQRSICAYKSCTNILFFKDLLAFRTKLWKDSRNRRLPYLKKRLGKVHYLSSLGLLLLLENMLVFCFVCCSLWGKFVLKAIMDSRIPTV